MASTTFSGPVTSTGGFVGNVTGDVTGDVTATDVTVSGVLDAQGTANIFVVPTSDPGVAGALWNNGGTLAISAG
ncbi:MAG: hypothetical protein GWN94_01500 [Phycisphaerae bacterium]|nr:hypothetical protein [Phycisphaerae bacterium]